MTLTSNHFACRLLSVCCLVLFGGLLPAVARADTVQARCDVYPVGDDHASSYGPCTFSQRQGYVTLRRQDGTVHELAPEGDSSGKFVDQFGHPVYRQSGLGRDGLIFRFPQEAIYVYWQGSARDESGRESNPTWPYSTADYDATTLLPCGLLDGEEGSCPAGVLRMADRQASIVVTSPDGTEFTFNFMRDYVNATGREVEAELKGDTWYLVVDRQEFYRVPLAAIEGG